MKQGLDKLKKLKDIYDNPDKYKQKPETKCSGTYSDALPISRKQAYELADQYCDKLDKKSKDTSKELKWEQYTFKFNYKAGNKCWSECKETVHDMICKDSAQPPHTDIVHTPGLSSNKALQAPDTTATPSSPKPKRPSNAATSTASRSQTDPKIRADSM